MRTTRVVYLFMALALIASGLLAQGTGTTSSLSGNVTTDGKALPGVTVTISSPALQGTRTAVTGEAGGYNFPALPPGAYTVSFELEGMNKINKRATLTLAQPAHVDAEMKVAGVTEAITVTASAPAVLETTEISRNFSQKQISELPVRRNVRDTVLLAPGTNSNGPNNQITISGGPSFDNLFLVNGVVVNENLRGQPHDLFIEDAIQETTIITGAISAEYGRFTGGVVSSITKSGGNEFTGSLRDSTTNPKWISKTAFRDSNGALEPDHINKISNIYEGTLGGYAIKDRLWFFGAGRYTRGAPVGNAISTQVTTLFTNIPFQNTNDEDRYEGKLTGQVTSRHNLVASYLNVKRIENNNFFPPIYDSASIVAQRQLPNTLKALAYNGVLTSNLLVEGQISQKKFAFIHSGGLFTDQIRGTWIADSRARFNAPVFCGVCTNEERNNDSGSVKGSYYLNTKTLGTHNFAVGGELYKETRLVNNNQSASDFNIGSTGTATFLPGDSTPYPHFDSNTTINWQPILINSTGSHLNTTSVFANDKWELNNHWSFNVGVRYDKNNAHDASGNLVSDDSAFSPRLGAILDLKGDGRSRFNLSYATYVTKVVDGNVGGAANAAGSPARFTWAYGGPAVNPLLNGSIVGTPVAPAAALQILFNWFNANCSPTPTQCGTASTNFFSSNYPGYTQRILSPIASPKVNEINFGYGQQIGRAGFARVDLINRRWKNFYALKLNKDSAALGPITAPNGTVNDVAYLVNDNSIKRKYDAAQFTFGWNPSHWNIGGGYTYAKLRGSDTTESDGSASSPIRPLALVYPEFLGYANRIPEGFLYGDQRHRAKVWAGYDFATRIGTMNLSAIQNADSGKAFSAVGAVSIAPGAYTGAPTAASVPYYTRSQLGTNADYYFSSRGAFRTPSVLSTDLAYNWNLPAFAKTTVFLQAQALNIFNNSHVATIVQGQLDTTIKTSRTTGAGLVAFNPFTDTPVECPQGATPATCTGMKANWQKGDTFGQGISKDAYQTPRTYRFAVGLRF